MIEIAGVGQVTENVFIAGARAIYAAADLHDAGVSHVLKLYFDDPYWPEDFTVLEHPLEDGVFIERETLEQGVSFVRSAVQAGHKVVVVCQMGASRSATFVLAHLLEQGHDLEAAFRLLRSVRPIAWPARALWSTLIMHYQAP